MSQAVARASKIVVVDDDARIRDLLRRYLTQEGFEVVLAEDGKALTRLMLREAADLAAACERHLPAWARLGPMNGGVVACIHVPPPPPNQMIYVRVAAGQAARSLDDLYAIVGVLRTQGKTVDIGGAAYTLEVQSIHRL